MTAGQALLLAGAGLAAGFINALAGGGSVLTLPALEFVTGNPNVANATNRIAILLQNVAGVLGYQSGGKVPWPQVRRLVLFAVPGGLCGAWLALHLSTGAMRVALAVAVLMVAITAVVKPPQRFRLRGWALGVAFFFVGFYAGFVQVGVGFLFLACLVGGLGLDLVRANAAKLAIVLVVTAAVLVPFGVGGLLHVTAGLVMAAGNMTGAWFAARLAIKKGAGFVKVIVVIAALGAITKLLLFPTGPR